MRTSWLPRMRASRARVLKTSVDVAPLLGVLVFVALTAIRPASGQEMHEHRHTGADHHGEVHFKTSCNADVQPDIDAAVAMLHSFGYEEARQRFLEVAQQDPGCGIAWWGVSMTYYHPLWAPPTDAEFKEGQSAAERAAELGGETPREQAYIDATSAFYDHEAADVRARSTAYKSAMAKVMEEFPDDPEASIFYALALLGTAPPKDTSYAQQKEAADILNRLLQEYPRHPGIAHYTIHAFDYPELAELALPAARVYAEIAPSSAHALHMPSHIFIRRGLWEESIATNLNASKAAREYVARYHPGAYSFEDLHTKDYLAYAYLQMGDDRKAYEVLEDVAKATRFDEPSFAAGYALEAVPARYALERRDWDAGAALQPPDVELPWNQFFYARGITHFAAGISAARIGDVERARKAVEALEELQAAAADQPPAGPYDWHGQIESMRLAVSGWLRFAEGDPEAAVRLLTEAAELEEAVGKHPVTPGAVLPARELLGDLLLEIGRADDALAAYEAALADSPGRFNGLAGAARAAELAGDVERARSYYQELLNLCKACERPIAEKAASFVGGS